MTADSLLIFEFLSHISFNAIDRIIDDNIDFNSVESKYSKNVCAEITSDVLNKQEQIHAIKKISFNTTTFI